MKLATTFAALAIAAMTVTPASAKLTCSSADMAKTNTMLATMPPTDQRMAMNKEFQKAASARLKGDMRTCTGSMQQIEKMSMTKSGK